MAKEAKKTVVGRVGEADPVFSMAQRAYDLITSQWPAIATFFATGGGVTLLAYLTDWARALGPLGIGLIVFAVAITAYLIVSLSLLWASKRQLNRASAEATDDWKKRTDNINPLDPDFNKRRIRISDLANPITKAIVNKKIINCELIGPANLAFVATRPGAGSIQGVSFYDCDVVVARSDANIKNAYAFIDSLMIDGAIYNCTLIVHPDLAHELHNMGANIITLTGYPEIDNRPRLGTGGRIRP